MGRFFYKKERIIQINKRREKEERREKEREKKKEESSKREKKNDGDGLPEEYQEKKETSPLDEEREKKESSPKEEKRKDKKRAPIPETKEKTRSSPIPGDASYIIMPHLYLRKKRREKKKLTQLYEGRLCYTWEKEERRKAKGLDYVQGCGLKKRGICGIITPRKHRKKRKIGRNYTPNYTPEPANGLKP